MNDNNLQNPVTGTPETPVTPITPVDPAPVQPAAPVQPVQPVAPVVPADPMAATVTPVQPVAPVAPMQPVQPVAPVAPVQPVAPAPVAPMAAPVQPVPQPVQPVPGFAPAAPGEQKDNKKLFIIIGVVAVVVIVGIILAVVFLGKGKDTDGGNKTDKDTKVTEKENSKDKSDKIEDILNDYTKREKVNEEIKNQFETKEYQVGEEVLIEFHNKTNYVVNADLQVEFYDENNTPVDVKDVYISGCPKNGVYYDGTYTNAKFASYKVKGKQELSIYPETYVSSVEVVSSNVSEGDYYIVQIKNNHTKELSDVGAIALFKDASGKIIAFREFVFSDIAPGDTAIDKRTMPYGEDYKTLAYDKVDVIVFEAKEKLEF